ncbi:hypothetical protein [Moorena sp. SIO2C4]|uniref:Uncharacterized protein n=1 Tax=Moorena producens 3L TaxID=489825 RepID=F4XRH7_9CYAN|nr:hypothetical protein [Moorena sp. SIO2C4]EGJ32820.1 hypothetical protein LYNGBM3L_75920 [Moorena producens 3L]
MGGKFLIRQDILGIGNVSYQLSAISYQLWAFGQATGDAFK